MVNRKGFTLMGPRTMLPAIPDYPRFLTYRYYLYDFSRSLAPVGCSLAEICALARQHFLTLEVGLPITPAVLL